jgi:hypothetical protein
MIGQARRRVCGVEVGAGRLVAVEIAGGRAAHATVVDVADGEAPSVPALLGAEGLGAGSLHLVAWDAQPVHQVVAVPPMPARDLRLFIEREATREAGGPRAVASERLGRGRGQDGKVDVLAISASVESVDRLLACGRDGRATPRLITTAPLALLAAARALAPAALAEPAILVHLGMSGLTLAVVADGRLGLARQLPLLATQDLDLVQWAAAEVQRSMRHYAMTSRGRAIGGLVCATHRRDAEPAFAAGLGAHVGLPVMDLNAPMAARLAGGGAGDVAAGVFVLAYGAALADPRRDANLLPATVLAVQRSARVTRRAVAAAVLIAVAAGAGLGWTARQAASRRAELRDLHDARRAREARMLAAAGAQGERDAAARRARLLLDDPLATAPVAEVLRELGRLAPDGVRVEHAAVARDERGYRLTLSGVAADPDLAAAQREFSALHAGLRASPLFHAVTFTRSTAGAPATAGPAAGSGSPGARLAFEISLRLREVR